MTTAYTTGLVIMAEGGVEAASHTTDLLLIGSNGLVVLVSLALTFYTARAANETAREVKRDDSRIIRLLVRRGIPKDAKHAKDPKEEK
jgi:hypothetical protein